MAVIVMICIGLVVVFQLLCSVRVYEARETSRRMIFTQSEKEALGSGIGLRVLFGYFTFRNRVNGLNRSIAGLSAGRPSGHSF